MVVHAEHVWGTVVSIHVPLDRCTEAHADAGIASAVEFLHHVDRVFSTFQPDSAVSMLRDGRLAPADASDEVRDVIQRCTRLRDLTYGAFDPWAARGGFDPSGLVKGWAADMAASRITEAGCPDVMVAAGGDVTVRGNASPETPWIIGLQHPDNKDAIYGTVSVTDCAVATSGRYERGDHIMSTTGIAAKSATVVGPDGATADALATALLIVGTPGLTWFQRLPHYSGQVVIDERVTSTGSAFTPSAS